MQDADTIHLVLSLTRWRAGWRGGGGESGRPTAPARRGGFASGGRGSRRLLRLPVARGVRETAATLVMGTYGRVESPSAALMRSW